MTSMSLSLSLSLFLSALNDNLDVKNCFLLVLIILPAYLT